MWCCNRINTSSMLAKLHLHIQTSHHLSTQTILYVICLCFYQNQTEGSLQQQIVTMEDERLNYEMSSKQSLRKVLEEKITAIQELSDVQVSLCRLYVSCYDNICVVIQTSHGLHGMIVCAGGRSVTFICYKFLSISEIGNMSWFYHMLHFFQCQRAKG